MPDNNINGQVHQAVTVDCHIPKDAEPGDYAGRVTLAAGGSSATLRLKVRVYSAVIPDDIFFNPELNCYGGPGEAGSAQFFNSYKIAHYNRCTINRVPYNQSGRVHPDWAPDVDESGEVTAWGRLDRNLGPLLDGSNFKENPRSGVPVPTIYLPLFEGWPLNYQKYVRAGPRHCQREQGPGRLRQAPHPGQADRPGHEPAVQGRLENLRPRVLQPRAGEGLGQNHLRVLPERQTQLRLHLVDIGRTIHLP